MHKLLPNTQRKIIHIDMDCFYAAIEIRDNPDLVNKPVAVGGPASHRGVLCTCNYIARKFGVRSAMPTAKAYQLCNELIVLPVNMQKYRHVAQQIHAIFHNFTDLVEPLSLDEAYLDVSHATDYQGSATLMAQAIRDQIWQSEQLTASAGISTNKLLAKIASGWKKPNGLFVIRPLEITNFMRQLPVENLFGVGKVTAMNLHRLGIQNCGELQALPLSYLTQRFGRLGQHLYQQCRGIDERDVEPNRIRKSLSVERTFTQDLRNVESCLAILNELYAKLLQRLKDIDHKQIKNQFLKIKFDDFKLATAEIADTSLKFERYQELFTKIHDKQHKPIRLLGVGIHFKTQAQTPVFEQQSFL